MLQLASWTARPTAKPPQRLESILWRFRTSRSGVSGFRSASFFNSMEACGVCEAEVAAFSLEHLVLRGCALLAAEGGCAFGDVCSLGGPLEFDFWTLGMHGCVAGAPSRVRCQPSLHPGGAPLCSVFRLLAPCCVVCSLAVRSQEGAPTPKPLAALRAQDCPMFKGARREGERERERERESERLGSPKRCKLLFTVYPDHTAPAKARGDFGPRRAVWAEAPKTPFQAGTVALSPTFHTDI